METTKTLLLNMAKENSDPELYGFYVDPKNGVALAGHRRTYGWGDALLRVRKENMDMGNLGNEEGVFDYLNNTFLRGVPGLPGKEIPNKGREMVNSQMADDKFNAVYAKVNGDFTLLLNPTRICEFIEERTRSGDLSNFKLNLQAFDGVSSLGQFPGQARLLDGVMTIALRTGRDVVPAYIDDKNSIIASYGLKEGEWYIVQPVAVVEGKHYVRVLRDFQRGVRLSLQFFRSGLLLPGSPRYSVFEEAGNGIGKHDILDMPFIEGQETLNDFCKAPYMHFDLDIIYSVLKTMVMYDVIEMRFKDSVTGVLFTGVPKEGQPLIDAIVGPTSPFMSGKVCTS